MEEAREVCIDAATELYTIEGWMTRGRGCGRGSRRRDGGQEDVAAKMDRGGLGGSGHGLVDTLRDVVLVLWDMPNGLRIRSRIQGKARKM